MADWPPPNVPKQVIASAHPLTQRVLNKSPFAPYAQAVGWVCMRLSFLEMVVTNLLFVLMPVKKMPVAHSLAGAMELKQKLQALRGVAAIRRPNDDWYERVIKIIGSIESTYAPVRNRYAHDVWVIDPEKRARKLRFNVSFPKTSGKGKRTNLTTLEETIMTLNEMYEIADAMDATAREIDNLRIEFTKAQRKRKPSP